MEPIQLNMGSVGEDNCFASIEFRHLIRVSPKRVEAGRRINPRKTIPSTISADVLGQPCKYALQHDSLDFGQESLSGNLLPVGVFNSHVSRECAKTRADTGNA